MVFAVDFSLRSVFSLAPLGLLLATVDLFTRFARRRRPLASLGLFTRFARRFLLAPLGVSARAVAPRNLPPRPRRPPHPRRHQTRPPRRPPDARENARTPLHTRHLRPGLRMRPRDRGRQVPRGVEFDAAGVEECV